MILKVLSLTQKHTEFIQLNEERILFRLLTSLAFVVGTAMATAVVPPPSLLVSHLWRQGLPIGEDPADHGHRSTSTVPYHTIPYHTMSCLTTPYLSIPEHWRARYQAHTVVTQQGVRAGDHTRQAGKASGVVAFLVFFYNYIINSKLQR